MKKMKGININKRLLALVVCVQIVAAMMLGGCGSGEQVISPEKASSTVIMTVADYEATLDEVYLYLIQYAFNYNLTPEAVGEGTFESVMSNVISQMKLDLVEYQLALVTDLEITEADIAEAQSGADAFYNYFGEEYLSNHGISYECVREMFERNMYIQALISKSQNDLANDYLEQFRTDYADLACHGLYYALFPSIQYDENNQPVTDEAGNYISLTEEEMQNQLALAEELRGRALAGESMEELVVEYGIEFCSGEEHNYSGAYEASLNAVVEGLGEGDISEVVTTAAGYMVVRMDDADDEEYKEYLLQYMAMQSANNMIPTLQQNWITASGISEVPLNQEAIDTIDFNELVTKLSEITASVN